MKNNQRRTNIYLWNIHNICQCSNLLYGLRKWTTQNMKEEEPTSIAFERRRTNIYQLEQQVVHLSVSTTESINDITNRPFPNNQSGDCKFESCKGHQVDGWLLMILFIEAAKHRLLVDLLLSTICCVPYLLF